MKHLTRIPVKPESVLLQAANLFDALRQCGKNAALIVPDMWTVEMIRERLSLPDGCVFAATAPGTRWLSGRAFEVYVIANETLCADAVHREQPGEGQFIHLLAHRQSTFPDAHIYAFTESRERVTTDTQQTVRLPMFKTWAEYGTRHHLVCECADGDTELVTHKYWRKHKQRWEYVTEERKIVEARIRHTAPNQ